MTKACFCCNGFSCLISSIVACECLVLLLFNHDPKLQVTGIRQEEYLDAIREAGFEEITVVRESHFPAELIAEQPLLKELAGGCEKGVNAIADRFINEYEKRDGLLSQLERCGAIQVNYCKKRTSVKESSESICKLSYNVFCKRVSNHHVYADQYKKLKYNRLKGIVFSIYEKISHSANIT